MTSQRRPTSPSSIGTIIVDLDGVVYRGSTLIDGATPAIEALQSHGWNILFATNNSTKTPASIAHILEDRADLVVHPNTVITSGMAAAAHLVSRGIGSAMVVGSDELAETIRERGIIVDDPEQQESVVVGLDRALTYDKIDRAAHAIRNGAHFVATNTDATFPLPDRVAPGAGTVVAAIAEASGAPFVACGKPHKPMAELVQSRIGTDQVWMVGDRPETDIAFAVRAGWRSVLTLTGVTTSRDEIPSNLVPDYVIASIAELPSLLTPSD